MIEFYIGHAPHSLGSPPKNIDWSKSYATYEDAWHNFDGNGSIFCVVDRSFAYYCEPFLAKGFQHWLRHVVHYDHQYGMTVVYKINWTYFQEDPERFLEHSTNVRPYYEKAKENMK